MTPEKQRIAIAKACGVPRLWSTALPERAIHCDVPDYLNDLNAMHEAEKVLTKSQRSIFMYQLYGEKVTWNDWPRVHSTAAQRAEAFLRTIGKWEQSA